nr:hypothetical protein Josef01_10c16_38 [uncultured archaeon]
MDYFVTTLILIIAQGCMSDNMQVTLAHDLNYNNNTGYEPYLSPDPMIVCMGGVDIHSIESVTLPLLRQIYADNPIVFVYGSKQSLDYQLYISQKYGSEYYGMADGNSDVERGYALAPFSRIAIQHERAHIELCAAHVSGTNADNPSTWVRTASRPWCPLTPLRNS